MKNKAHFSKFMKNSKFWEKNWMNRQKVHTEGKSLPKSNIIDWSWSLEKRRKSVRHKGKEPTKRFSYELTTPKPRDQEIQKFLPNLISTGDCTTSGEKRTWKRFWALRYNLSCWGLRLNLGGSKRFWLVLEICFYELCTKQKRKPTSENYGRFESGSFHLPKF